MNYIKLLSLIFIISSCIDKEKTLDNGVLLKYFKNGSGNQIKDDEIMLLIYSILITKEQSFLIEVVINLL